MALFLMVSDHSLKDGFCAILRKNSFHLVFDCLWFVFCFWFADLCTLYTRMALCVWLVFAGLCMTTSLTQPQMLRGWRRGLIFSQKLILFFFAPFDFSETEIIAFSPQGTWLGQHILHGVHQQKLLGIRHLFCSPCWGGF